MFIKEIGLAVALAGSLFSSAVMPETRTPAPAPAPTPMVAEVTVPEPAQTVPTAPSPTYHVQVSVKVEGGTLQATYMQRKFADKAACEKFLKGGDNSGQDEDWARALLIIIQRAPNVTPGDFSCVADPDNSI